MKSGAAAKGVWNPRNPAIWGNRRLVKTTVDQPPTTAAVWTTAHQPPPDSHLQQAGQHTMSSAASWGRPGSHAPAKTDHTNTSWSVQRMWGNYNGAASPALYSSVAPPNLHPFLQAHQAATVIMACIQSPAGSPSGGLPAMTAMKHAAARGPHSHQAGVQMA